MIVKLTKRRLGIILVVLILGSCAPPSRIKMEPREAKWVQKMLAQMSLQEKVAQMVCCRVKGNYLHREVALKIFESSITCVKNQGGLLPLDKEKSKIALWTLSSDPGGYFAGRAFIRSVGEIIQPVSQFQADAFTGQEFIDQALKELEKAEVVVIGLFSRLRSGKGSVDLQPRFIELIKKLAHQPQPVIAISFGSPYFLQHFPEIDVYICAYRYADEAQQAAARALFGEIPLQGRLPVSIPGCFPRGHGLLIPRKN
ncbi:MAG TPA: hypothetical protein ENF17_07895 [Candidatus Aminicenantes bacterium]|nr:hypothetical protein [Candidatus Aminicenantes bacterium]